MHSLSTDSGVDFHFNSDLSGDVRVAIPGRRGMVDIPGSALVELAAYIACARVEEWVQSDLYNVIVGKKP